MKKKELKVNWSVKHPSGGLGIFGRWSLSKLLGSGCKFESVCLQNVFLFLFLSYSTKKMEGSFLTCRNLFFLFLFLGLGFRSLEQRRYEAKIIFEEWLRSFLCSHLKLATHIIHKNNFLPCKHPYADIKETVHHKRVDPFEFYGTHPQERIPPIHKCWQDLLLNHSSYVS